MSTLDFTELVKDPPGESFEALTRLIGERLGLIVQWSGRGADRGRDLVFVENQVGPLKTNSIRWLVSCKDNAVSNKAVSENDIGSVTDKVQQHKCHGFLLATSTTVSTALKEKLDQLDMTMGGPIHTKVWDRFDLTNMLLTAPFADLLLQFFPKQQRRDSVEQLDAARQVIEASLPRFTVGFVRQHLMSYNERLSLLSGDKVWPHDLDQAILINELRQYAVRADQRRAVEKVQQLHFDAFMAFADSLVRNFPQYAEKLLRSVAQRSTDSAVCYNVIEILREADAFSLEDEIEITRSYDSDTLFYLYHDLAHEILEDTKVWDWRLPPEVQSLDDKVELLGVNVEDLEFSGGDSVSLNARVRLTVQGNSFDPDIPSTGERHFSYNFEAHFESDGIDIDRIK